MYSRRYHSCNVDASFCVFSRLQFDSGRLKLHPHTDKIKHTLPFTRYPSTQQFSANLAGRRTARSITAAAKLVTWPVTSQTPSRWRSNLFLFSSVSTNLNLTKSRSTTLPVPTSFRSTTLPIPTSFRSTTKQSFGPRCRKTSQTTSSGSRTRRRKRRCRRHRLQRRFRWRRRAILLARVSDWEGCVSAAEASSCTTRCRFLRPWC